MKRTHLSERVDRFVREGSEGALFRMGLHEGAKRRFITDVPAEDIFRYLRETVDEMEDAFSGEDRRELFNESADLMNWANALIHSQAREELDAARRNLTSEDFEWPEHDLED